MKIRLYMESEITSDHTNRIKNRLLEVIHTNSSYSSFIFDFTKTTKMDSTGIGIIKSVCDEMSIRQKKICLENVSHNVLELMRIMRLDRYVQIKEKNDFSENQKEFLDLLR